MLGKFDKMSARDALIDLAGRPPAYGEQPRWLKRVADIAKITPRTARSIWEGRISNPEHLAVRLVARAIEEKRKNEQARRDAEEIADIFHRHAQALSNIDAEFHRPTIDAFVEAAGVVSRRNCT